MRLFENVARNFQQQQQKSLWNYNYYTLINFYVPYVDNTQQTYTGTNWFEFIVPLKYLRIDWAREKCGKLYARTEDHSNEWSENECEWKICVSNSQQ